MIDPIPELSRRSAVLLAGGDGSSGAHTRWWLTTLSSLGSLQPM